MSFSVNIIGNLKIKRTLQVPRKIAGFIHDTFIRPGGLQKRMRFSVLGSLTVEAALAMPVFVTALAGLLCVGQIFYLQTRIQTAMEQTGEELAAYYYAVKSWKESGEEGKHGLESILGGFLEGISSAVFAQGRIRERVGEDILDHSMIEDGSAGLSMAGSSLFQEDDRVDLTVSYKIKIPYLDFLKPITVTQRCVRRAWTGRGGGEGTEEEIVYITDTGTVYHTMIDCTYLKPSLEEIGYDDVEERRNESGETFSPCEKCTSAGGGPPMVVYITKYGNRYHFSVICTALTRGIRSVRKSEVAGMPLCSKCGGGGG